MEIDAEVRFPLEKMSRELPDFAAMPEADQRTVLAESLIRQVMAVANEELQRHGLRPKRSIKGGGHEQETDAEIMVNQLGETYVTFRVAFQGNQEGATAATDRWIERVKTFGGIARIGRASLRGTDGTNAHMFDEETEAMAASLDEETLAKIDELMDPNRSDDRLGH